MWYDTLKFCQFNSNLTANSKPFRFGFDNVTQKYGYIIESGGADTFFPFKSETPIKMDCGGGGHSATTLYNVKTIDFTDSIYTYGVLTINKFKMYGMKNDVKTAIFEYTNQDFPSSAKHIYDVSEYDSIILELGSSQNNNWNSYIENFYVVFND